MTTQLLQFIRTCIENDNLLPFYKLTAWKHVRADVIKLDHGECQHCKERGKHVAGSHVHHVCHVKDRPELALSIWYTDEAGKTKRNLVTLCHACHEIEHNHRGKIPHAPPLTEERW